MSEVHFIPVPAAASDEQLATAARRVIAAANLDALIQPRQLVAIKSHFGEAGNHNVVPPAVLRAIGERVRERGGRPFLVETATLYTGGRSDAVGHLLTAHENGFSVDAVGMPLLMADGLDGDAELEVEVPGGRLGRVSLAREVLHADALIATSHLTGHMVTGFGGAIKNLGMGLASRRGKRRQHSAMNPRIKEEACTACGNCVARCASGAITLGDVARIDSALCVGCGECLTACRDDAVRYDWGVESRDLQQRMVEHAAGIVRALQGRVVFLNFLTRITKDCDCMHEGTDHLTPDIGVLASTDLVAIEAASLALVATRAGKPLRELAYPKLDPQIQIAYAEQLGLGSARYQLVEVTGS